MPTPELSKEAFLHMAQVYGLDPKAPYMDDLYVWVKNNFKALEPLDDLDLTDVDPDLTFIPGQE